MATNDETYIPYGALRSGRVCALAVDGKEYIVYDISRAFQVVCCEENAVEVEGFFFGIRGVASKQLELVVGRCQVITLELKIEGEFI
jgi:hypothetical protein